MDWTLPADRHGRPGALSRTRPSIRSTRRSASPTTSPASAPATRPANELARRLLDPRGEQGPLQRMLSLMGESALRLSEAKDAGKETQHMQSEALAALDEAIAEARRNLNQASSSARPTQGESRRAGQVSPTSQDPDKSAGNRPARSAARDSAAAGGDAKKRKPLRDQAELRRGWGYLPERDREAILQGAGEEIDERYRDEIVRYYRAIAEQAEQKSSRERPGAPR